jgi:hypothetical protein
MIYFTNTNDDKNRMFARLQEAFANDIDRDQSTYLNDANIRYKSIPGIIPANFSLPLDDSIQTLDPIGQNYQTPVVPYPNHIIMPTSPTLIENASRCSSSSIDQLLAIKNPSAMNGYGCGWMYTPPTKGSSTPVISQGFYGNADGPIPNMKHPEYKKWFFNLEQAKRQILMDKCNAMSSCTDLSKDEFSSQCAWCEDRNQGIPVNNTGQLLYSNDPMGNCSTDSVYTSASQCPAPISTRQGTIDQSCELINGQLPVACIKKQIRTAGCSDNGALSIALSSATPTNYIENLPSSDAVKIYNRHVSPPFHTDIFKQGKTTVDEVMKEVRALAGNMQQPPHSAIGAAARDLCIQRGALQQYDICNEYSDSTSPPFLLQCVQKIFLSMGGHGKGGMYPTESNLPFYNTKGSLGAVRQYVQTLLHNTQSTNYNVQRDAMIQLLGITPDELITRVPYTQGVEVFWFVPTPGVPLKNGNLMPISGFLKRTIESKIINLDTAPSRISQLNGNGYGCMVQLTDVRTPEDFKTTFQVIVDDGFFIAVNQPADIDKKVFTRVNADEPGLFQSIGLQGSTTYTSNQPCSFYTTSPNIMKVYFEDAGSGWNALKIHPMNNVAQKILTPTHFSLTCEKTAPFLIFEVDRSNEFEELRNPGIFSQFCRFVNMTPFYRADDRSKVPGKKGFVRLNSSSCMSLRNIAFQSWRTMTAAVRFTTMPVKATFFSMASGQPGSGPYCCMVAIPAGNGQMKMQFEHRGLDGINRITPVPEWLFSLNSWFLFTIVNIGTGFIFKAQWLDTVVQSGNVGATKTIDLTSGRANTFYGINATWNPAPGQTREVCDVAFGTSVYQGWSSMYTDTNFNYDVAWVHFFEHVASDGDVKRDASCDWVYTQFPRELNSY